MAQHVPGTRRQWAQAVERGAVLRGIRFCHRGLEAEHTRSAPATTRDSGHSVTSCTDVCNVAAAELQLRLLHAPRPKQECRTDRTSRNVDKIPCSFTRILQHPTFLQSSCMPVRAAVLIGGAGSVYH